MQDKQYADRRHRPLLEIDSLVCRTASERREISLA